MVVIKKTPDNIAPSVSIHVPESTETMAFVPSYISIAERLCTQGNKNQHIGSAQNVRKISRAISVFLFIIGSVFGFVV